MKTKTIITILLSSILYVIATKAQDYPKVFYDLTKKDNKVYVNSDEKNTAIHVKKCIMNWGYWKLTEEKKDADFILTFNIRGSQVIGFFANAQFINPANNEILHETPNRNSIVSWDINAKREVIKKIFKKDIKPIFKLKQNNLKQEKKKTQQANPPPTKTKTDRLRELKQMFDEKLITKEEYEKERKKTLDEKE